MNNTPTPRTDARHVEVQMQDLQIGHQLRELINFARQLEQELNELKEIQKQMILDAFPVTEERVKWECLIQERDKLRKVCDALAAVVRGEFGHYNWRVSAYNQLPHVIERKKI